MMMSLLPNGLLGLTFAALVAAIVSSLASMTNSVSTIFTMDIYRSFVNSKPSEQKLVNVGRNMAWISLFIAVLCAQPLLGSMESAFQYIQNFTCKVLNVLKCRFHTTKQWLCAKDCNE